MTLFLPTDKNWEEKLNQAEKEELEEYCKEQGFSEQQTEIFIKNSLENSQNVYLGE